MPNNYIKTPIYIIVALIFDEQLHTSHQSGINTPVLSAQLLPSNLRCCLYFDRYTSGLDYPDQDIDREDEAYERV